jgi:hypothetical protein
MKDLHGIWTVGNVPVQSRTGKIHQIAGPLLPSATILAALDDLVDRYRNKLSNGMDLFANGFDGCLRNQKQHIENCIKDP